MTKIDMNLFLKYIKPNTDEENNYCDYQLCGKCGGNCCKSMGCHISPDDLSEVTYESIRDLIESGCVSIDQWEADKPIYYLRMRNSNGKEYDLSWGGICVLFGESGCPLEFSHRPKGARHLIPSGDGRCNDVYSKSDCKDDWKKYQDILSKVLNDVKNR